MRAFSSREGLVFFCFRPGLEIERGGEEEEGGDDRSTLFESSEGEQRSPSGENKDVVVGGLGGRASL